VQLNAVVFGVTVTLKLLVINSLPSFPAINKHRRLRPIYSDTTQLDVYSGVELRRYKRPLGLLPAIRSVTTCGMVVRRRRIDNTWPVPAALTERSEARYRLRIAISCRMPITPSAFDAPVTGAISRGARGGRRGPQ